jgi:hypothetical protein
VKKMTTMLFKCKSDHDRTALLEGPLWSMILILCMKSSMPANEVDFYVKKQEKKGNFVRVCVYACMCACMRFLTYMNVSMNGWMGGQVKIK